MNEIDKYISGFPMGTQKLLKQLRAIIRRAAPDAEERISYGIPSFTLNGNLVHFAAYKKHIGLYPAPRGVEAFKKHLSVYKGAKATVQFPLDKPLPADLIVKIVKCRVRNNLQRAEARAR